MAHQYSPDFNQRQFPRMDGGFKGGARQYSPRPMNAYGSTVPEYPTRGVRESFSFSEHGDTTRLADDLPKSAEKGSDVRAEQSTPTNSEPHTANGSGGSGGSGSSGGGRSGGGRSGGRSNGRQNGGRRANAGSGGGANAASSAMQASVSTIQAAASTVAAVTVAAVYVILLNISVVADTPLANSLSFSTTVNNPDGITLQATLYSDEGVVESMEFVDVPYLHFDGLTENTQYTLTIVNTDTQEVLYNKSYYTAAEDPYHVDFSGGDASGGTLSFALQVDGLDRSGFYTVSVTTSDGRTIYTSDASDPALSLSLPVADYPAEAYYIRVKVDGAAYQYEVAGELAPEPEEVDEGDTQPEDTLPEEPATEEPEEIDSGDSVPEDAGDTDTGNTDTGDTDTGSTENPNPADGTAANDAGNTSSSGNTPGRSSSSGSSSGSTSGGSSSGGATSGGTATGTNSNAVSPENANPEAPPEGAVPAEEAPAEEVPGEEIPAEEAPAEEIPAEEVPEEELPGEEAPEEEVPEEEAPEEELPGEEVPEDGVPTDENTPEGTDPENTQPNGNATGSETAQTSVNATGSETAQTNGNATGSETAQTGGKGTTPRRSNSSGSSTRQTTSYNYEAIAWTWAEDWSAATAYISGIGTEGLTISAEVSTTRTEATCTRNGSIVHTAVIAGPDGNLYSDTKTVELAALGHDFTELATDDTQEAYYRCARCGAEIRVHIDVREEA